LISLLRLFTPALLALLVLAPLQAASPARDWNLPARDWYEGPVRYLLTWEEEKKFRALTTDGERAAFIEDFWARRDADPATPANEFEIRFWKRVEEADHLFRDAPYPGWKTDRGKLYILLGAPDEIREEQAYGRRGKEVPFVLWTYHRPRFEGMERETEIRFQKDESGEFHITDRIFLNRLEWLSGAARNVIYGAEAAQRPPEPRQILDTVMASRPPTDSRRFRTHYDFFKAADGSTSVVLTLGIRMNPPGPPVSVSPPPQTVPAETWKVYARISDGTASYDLVDQDSFRTLEIARDVGGFRLYQGRISVPPGAYSVFYGIRDESKAELFSLSERVQVPDFTLEAFSLSGITLASLVEPAEHPETEQPFLIGRLRVIPKMDPTYRIGSDLACYFQVYSPRFGPQTGEADLDLTYQFYEAAELRKTGEATYAPFGKPLRVERQSGLAHGYSFPLTGWSPGEFKLRVIVRDRITDATAEAEATFSVR